MFIYICVVGGAKGIKSKSMYCVNTDNACYHKEQINGQIFFFFFLTAGKIDLQSLLQIERDFN